MKDYALNYKRRVSNFPRTQRKAYLYILFGIVGFWGARKMIDYAM